MESSAWFIKFLNLIWPFIGSHLVHASLFAAIAWVFTVLLRKHPAQLRYTILLAASLRFAFPAVMFLLLFQRFPMVWSHLLPHQEGKMVMTSPQPTVTGYVVKQQEVVRKTPVPLPRVQLSKVYCAMTAVWMMGVAALFMRRWQRRKTLARLVEQAEPCVAVREAAALKGAKELAGVTREIALRLTGDNLQPGVWGVMHPTILLPRQLSERLTDAELETVLVHEMAHIARWDNMVGNMQAFLCYIFWFDPLVWILNRQLLVEREHACDEVVIRKSLSRRIYVSAILKTCRCSLEWQTIGIAGIAGAGLKRRIKRIMNHDPQSRKIVSRPVATMIIVMVAFLWFGTELLGLRSWAAQHPQLVSLLTHDRRLAILQSEMPSRPPSAVTVGAPSESPVSLSRVRALFAGFNPSSRRFAVRLVGTITNPSGKRVTKLAFSVSRPGVDYLYYGESGDLHIEPGQSIDADIGVIGGKDEIQPPLGLQVTAVRFADGSTWGTFESDLLTSPLNPNERPPSEPGPADGPSDGPVGGVSDGIQTSAPPAVGVQDGIDVSLPVNGFEGGVSQGPPSGGIEGDFVVRPSPKPR
jgi:beta-lactamase regulating signal transducer with metallopeptidase domain